MAIFREHIMKRWLALAGLVMVIVVAAADAQQRAQGPRAGISVPPLGDGPFVFDTGEQHKIRVSVVTKGLSHPWSLVFLPDGNMLITERAGRLRVVRNGVLDQTPVPGLPQVKAQGLAGLMDLALHPRFNENKLVYFSYHKPDPNPAPNAPANAPGVITLGRGRWDGAALTDVKDLFSAIPDANASRIVFGKDGMVYMSIGIADPPNAARAQDPNDLAGKVLRLKDDGTVPSDNPFVGRSGYRPEIFTMGHRNPLGLMVHPDTGAVWEDEDGPNGGDEVNILLPGRNYGWPVVSNGRFYAGPRVTEKPWQENMENPLVFWVPSIAISGMAFYNGDRFPNWKGNLFVGGMRQGEIPGTGHMQRIVFNDKTEEIRREPMLVELRQRIRDIRQGPDGLLYILTEENEAALLKIEPTN
jgi:aldose sugar dehydrogenase